MTIDRVVKIQVVENGLYGLYNFEDRSSTGKTYLCNLLKAYNRDGEPVWGYTYDDFRNGVSIRKAIEEGYKLVVIDRYDMYYGEMLEDINELAKNCIVLVACNRFLPMKCDYDLCFIEMEAAGGLIKAKCLKRKP
ncbi:MAG: hypothetical protein IKV41_00150 [Oscillospiraceae bacterium]|nr:hypothetical protein [Oscillospiraceae bacterium]